MQVDWGGKLRVNHINDCMPYEVDWGAHETHQNGLVEFWGLPPLILFFNMSTGWFGRFALSTECYRTRKLDYNDLNWPRCSAQVTESLALTDGGFC